MKTLGLIMLAGGGGLLWVFMIMSFYQWWDVGGIIAGFLLSPGVVLFPLIFWGMEGVFPVSYFIIWGVAMVGMAMMMGLADEQ